MTKKRKSVKKTEKTEFDFPGRIEFPFPVEVIWDDAFKSSISHYSIESVEALCLGPAWSQSYGKLLYASKEEIVLGHFLHTDPDGTINTIREPIRIALPMIYEITILKTGKVIYRKKGHNESQAG